MRLLLLLSVITTVRSFAPLRMPSPKTTEFLRLEVRPTTTTFLSLWPTKREEQATTTTSRNSSGVPTSTVTTNQSSALAIPSSAATVLVGTPAAALFWASNALSALPSPPPFVVSEILTDLSHVALDLVTLWGPSAVVVRLFAVIGRILCVLADYLPDGFMNPEEVVFQGFMLAVALIGLLQVMLPQIWSQFLAPKPTLRDGKAYTAWGKPAGMSWDQYKALTVSALEWKELRPGEKIQVNATPDLLSRNDKNQQNQTTLFWLYKGDVKVQRAGHKKSHVIRRNTHRLRQVDGVQHVDLASLQSAATLPNPESRSTTITAGEHGATLLTCRMDRLSPLLRHDASLKDVWKVILWQGMQDQLADAYHDDTAYM